MLGNNRSRSLAVSITDTALVLVVAILCTKLARHCDLIALLDDTESGRRRALYDQV